MLTLLGALLFGMGVAGALELARGGSDRTGTVISVIDGDTVIMSIAGEETTVRLLNVDTPETKDPNKPVQCMGPEAAEWLAQRLPAGTEVELEYDEERTDRYGRTLAAVSVGGSLINREIAEQGLGVAVSYEPNTQFFSTVRAGQKEAEEGKRGLFDPMVECSLPAQVQAAQASLSQIPPAASTAASPAAAPAGADDILSSAETLVSAVAPGGNLVALGLGIYAADSLSGYRDAQHALISDEHQKATGRLRAVRADFDKREQVRRAEQARSSEARTVDEKSAAQSAPKRPAVQTPRPAKEEPTRPKESKPSAPAQQQPKREAPSTEKPRRSPKQEKPKPAPKQEKPKPKQEKPKPAPKQEKPKPKQNKPTKSGKSSCVPYGPEIPYGADGGYTGKRYGMPGGKTFRKCR
ncbi:thermonuclease family protein [Helcobacillus sp. ACRRO]|uniref:thermonuclease family protein n=1 Tax=Helcobacillus sp. ACRRO TaxID=2918202 RepID=UPI001EF5DF08|nr:thermonuclease family protein [Helcobacillus sp. ACRRO]